MEQNKTLSNISNIQSQTFSSKQFPDLAVQFKFRPFLMYNHRKIKHSQLKIQVRSYKIRYPHCFEGYFLCYCKGDLMCFRAKTSTNQGRDTYFLAFYDYLSNIVKVNPVSWIASCACLVRPRNYKRMNSSKEGQSVISSFFPF